MMGVRVAALVCVWRWVLPLVCVWSWVLPLVSASCFPALFNFGDSQSDTGGIQATFPGYTPAEYLPYGETFFESPQNRYCDGRLFIDFIAEGLGIPYLDPYLNSVTSNFRHGANFATAGATVQDVTYLSPFNMGVQTLHFLAFKRGTLNLLKKDKWTWARTSTDVKSGAVSYAERVNRLPPEDYFYKALYTICIGGNDFTYAYTHGKSIEQLKEDLPKVVQGIALAIRRIHDEGGGRNFLVYDMEPQGCLPYIKTLISHKPEDLDELNCLPPYNEAALFFNNLLNDTLEEMRQKYTDSNIVMLSLYDMKMDIFRDPQTAGFKVVHKACCGVPNEYHYDLRVWCGQKNTFDNVTYESETCENPNDYVCWDGTHTTEAANRYQAKQIFMGKYLYPQFKKLTEGCDLSPLS